jgi:hypothetical protein
LASPAAGRHCPTQLIAPEIAADFFALRKSHTGSRWVFSEARNNLNPNSHCDIAWAGALATHAFTERNWGPAAMVG